MSDILQRYHDYLMIEKNYSEHTAQSYITDIKGFEAFIINEGLAKDLLSVNRPRLARNYISFLDTQNYTKKTVSRKISSLKNFYNYLVFKSLIDVNVFLDIKAPKIPKTYHILLMMRRLNTYLNPSIHQRH